MQKLEYRIGNAMFGIGSQKSENFRSFDSDARDLVIAFKRVVLRRYGKDSLCGVPRKIIFKGPVTYVSVATSCTETEKGIFDWVRVKAKALDAVFCVAMDNHPQIYCEADVRFEKEIEDFMNAIAGQLKQDSIYRNKAVTLKGKFIDVAGVNIADFVYNSAVLQALETHIWTIIEQPERCKQHNLQLQRKILLVGTYGAGKTFTARLTAKKANAHGWTFFYMPATERGNSDAIRDIFALARKYQPAVILIEDIDHEQRIADDYHLKKTLEEVDGIISKSDNIVVIMTANKADNIAGGLQRPGRIDAIIRLGILNAEDIERLIKVTAKENMLETNIDWREIAKHCEDYSPAFIKEIATNALLCMISKRKEKISTEMLVQAAKDLKSQADACAQSMGFKQK